METALLKGPLPRIRWAAVIAGALCALAIQIVLGLFGTAMGISASPADSNEVGVFAAIWSVLTPAIASLVGAYVATRVASAIHPAGTYLHGVLVWCIGLIAGALFLTGILAGGAISGGRALSREARLGEDGAAQQSRTERSGNAAAGASALAGLSALFGLVGAIVGSISGRRAVLTDRDVREKWLPHAVRLDQSGDGSERPSTTGVLAERSESQPGADH
jgi:hypothetical protein